MTRPPARVMLLGHPVISVPLMLAALATLGIGIYGGNRIACLIGMGELGMVQSASAQRRKFLAWQADWDAMSPDGLSPRKLTVGRFIGAVLVAGLALVGYQHADTFIGDAAYALGWTLARPWLLAALGAVIVLSRMIRSRSRRARPAPTVTVIARRVLPVPSLADAYRALPDYCHALLGNRP